MADKITEAISEAKRAHGRIDGVKETVTLLREDLSAHRLENTTQHRENLSHMEKGFARVHKRVDNIYAVNRKATWAIIGLLLTVLGYLIVSGRPWG
jgi:hypothetical protein